MFRKICIALSLPAFVLSLSMLPGCEEESGLEDAMEDTEEAAEDAADDTEDAMEDAGD